MTTRAAILTGAAVLAVGAALVWVWRGSRPEDPLTPSVAMPPPTISTGTPAVPPAPPIIAPSIPEPASSPAQAEEIVSLAPHLPLSGEMLPWEAAVKRILDSPSGPGVRAQALFGLLPRLPEEALATTTEQATTWLRDRDYAATAAPLIENPTTHGAILSVMFADLMERPDPVTLPTLLAIARQPSHPFAAAARDNLSLLLGSNHGADWAAWESSIRQRLAGP